jgi:hypothetical protein
MKRHPYTYLVLRHTGGIDGGESLNVGVILCCPTLNTAMAKFRTEAGRLAAAFPEIDERDFTARMTKLSNRAATLGGNPAGYAHALDFAKALLAQNEAARLNWELVERAGVTIDPVAELDHLFKDLVSARDAAFAEKFVPRPQNPWKLASRVEATAQKVA